MSYPFREIEEKWQDIWEKKNTFKTDIGSKKPKYYCLDMFPYPSGAGLHVGHPEGYTATDIISRFKRMKGFEVLHPMGWDAFGLPAERYAMTHGIHPRITTEQNVNNFRRQIKSLGLSYDWSREISTTDPSYYRHTQWIFLKIYNSYFDHREKKAKPISGLIQEFEQSGSALFFTEQSGTDAHKFTAEEWKSKSPVDKEKILSGQRLVYSAEIPVNWCEELGTVLANEEVEEWTAKGYSVVRKPMRQYMMRITAYAERLLEDLSLVSWPQSTLEMQKNWIGRSEGCEIEFRTESNDPIPVFTTRPDTIFGATYLVLAPEHPLVKKITSKEQSAEVESYAKAASLKSDLDRTELNKEKTGVFTGSYALHPFTGEKIPVWISDYVLYHYGTGAIMAVPAHDERDFSFAKIMKLPIRHVIAGAESEDVCFDSKESKCINSKSDSLDINGLSYKEAFDKTASVLEKKGIGRKRLQYKLRDWLFARQRYWGEPIPLVHSPEGLTFDIPESELPLTLPELEDYKPDKSGESALAKATSWLKYESSGKSGRRETNTMPQWAGSCWYYLRFIDPVSKSIFCKSELEQKWMPVDLYVGGAEHAVLHLLYSRFWHKILFDLGYVSTPEPFKKLVHQGLILGEDKRKMSKSLGNVVNPDDVIKEFGADSFRLFEMFMGPLEMSKPWNTRGVEGVFRFLNRTWRLFHKEDGTFFTDDTEPDKEELKILNRTIQKVEVDIENLSFNTAISQMMIFVNEMTPKPNRPWKILRPFILLLAPFAPHLAEEIWSKFGYKNSLAHERFPYVDTAYLEDDTMVIVVQVNGKLRDQIEVSKTMEQSEIISLAKKAEKIPQYIEGKKMIKEIYVKEKLVNFVVGN